MLGGMMPNYSYDRVVRELVKNGHLRMSQIQQFRNQFPPNKLSPVMNTVANPSNQELFIRALQGGGASGQTNFATQVTNSLGRPDLGDLGGEIGNLLDVSDENFQQLHETAEKHHQELARETQVLETEKKAIELEETLEAGEPKSKMGQTPAPPASGG